MSKKTNSIFGDKRIDVAFNKLLESSSIRYTSVIRQLGSTHKESIQFYRLINNIKVTPDNILAHHWQASKIDFSNKHILVINDTSTFSFKAHRNREELGYIGTKTTKEGINVHPSIMVDAQTSTFYGIGGLTFHKTDFARTKKEQIEKQERQKNRWKLSLEEKERYKWFKSPENAITNCQGAKQYTLVGDRESDIYELIEKTITRGWGFIFRSKTNRRLENDNTLYNELANWIVKFTYNLPISETAKRTGHDAKLEVKCGKVIIKRPKDNKHAKKENIELNVVEVKEDPSTVIGEEKPIHWILLTSHNITTEEEVIQLINWYKWRWLVEQVFRTMKKKGLMIEKSELETYLGLQKLITIGLITAGQVMQLVQARDGKTKEKIENAFFEEEQKCIQALNKKLEGNTEKLKNPYKKESLAYASWVVARLGGWKGYKSEKPPGPITIINGLNKFYVILEGYYLMI